MGFAFSLKSVIITVKSPTVTSRCWALLLSMFFNLGLVKRQTKEEKNRFENCLEDNKQLSGWQRYDEFITSTFYGFSFSVLVLYRFCLSPIFLSSPFWGVWVVQTADLLAVQPVETQAVVF